MALDDPQAPAPWEWPAEFQVDPRAWGIPMPPTGQQITAPEYGVAPGVTPPPPPPPPPPPVKQIGGTMGVVENAAAPALAKETPWDPAEWRLPDVDLSPLQPGAEPEPPAPEADPWALPEGGLDAPRAQQAIDKAGTALVEPASEMLAKDPWALQEIDAKNELARADMQRDQLLAEDQRNRAIADRNAQAHVAAVAKAQAETQRISNEATALANTKIVRDRRSGGRTFLDVIMGALGGAISARTGGPNQGLQLVLQRINDDVEDQKAELQHKTSMLGMRRSIIGDELARSGDMYKAQELARLAAHDAAISAISAEAMKFNPQGTRAIQLAKMKVGLMQSRAAAVQALQDRELNRVGDQAKIEHDLLLNEQLRRKIAGSGVAAPQPVYTEQQLGSPTPPPGWTKGQGAWLEIHNKYLTSKKTGQEIAAGGKVGEEQRQQQLERTGMGLVDYDANGQRTEFVPKGTADEVKKLRNQKAGTQEMINLLDEAMSIRTGWTSDKVASEENQRLKTIMGKLKLAAKRTEDLGAITESDVDLIKGLVGTDDFTSWRGVTDGVAQARKNLIQSLRISTTNQGMSKRAAAEIDFPNLYAAKTKESQDDAAYRSVLNGDVKGNDATNVINSIYGLASPVSNPGDPKAREANMARLRQIAKGAPDEVDRKYAAAIIHKLETPEPKQPPGNWDPNNPGHERPAPPPPSKPELVHSMGPVWTVRFPDGTTKEMPAAEAIKAIGGGR